MHVTHASEQQHGKPCHHRLQACRTQPWAASKSSHGMNEMLANTGLPATTARQLNWQGAASMQILYHALTPCGGDGQLLAHQEACLKLLLGQVTCQRSKQQSKKGVGCLHELDYYATILTFSWRMP
jgi:hypothetical protein